MDAKVEFPVQVSNISIIMEELKMKEPIHTLPEMKLANLIPVDMSPLFQEVHIILPTRTNKNSKTL